MAFAGKNYDVLVEGDSWIKIAIGDSGGWIERRHVTVMEKPQNRFLETLRANLLILLAITAILAVVVFILKLIIAKSSRRISLKKSVLIVADKDASIPLSLTNTVVSLEKCFEEIGFTVIKVRSIQDLPSKIVHLAPDAILVDWKTGHDTHDEIQKLLLDRSATASYLVIFYNCPNPLQSKRDTRLRNAFFLGLSFTDRDVFKLITPHLITHEKETRIQKSVHASALEGKITEGSLSALFQFIEIGRKTGCLLLENEGPAGMVYFEQGNPTFASTGQQTSSRAVYSVLDLRSGRFRFVADKYPSEKNCTLSTMEALMEWSRRQDEARRR